ncbi:electron transport complex, RnfABCDGE type, B subunit [Ruminococcus sp. YE71]|uniref:RnfABCDGE type electron transport complex subunit B n=1 Tax=unclassified Ruminococcus TaxID=2608920 RepID=UPI000886A579|nr:MULTISPECIES: RnfABCDGE type electron transport complex subunit B [unclassified Ruminococcus]SDA14619.1 electron transport complex, RnfABCDGE type, B subunit [Ruminococcus sp. YE78]SFW21261.1 electron transport complex, RnfABCDGE type, B subunit [Ruminococcus sp. YE71]
MSSVIMPVALFAALGAGAGVLLTAASKVFAVRTDERVELIAEALPQANCGACGFSGCADYADAIVNRGAPCDRCKPGGEKSAKAIGSIMGVEVTAGEPQVAFVRCGGDCTVTPHKYVFEGLQSCADCNRFYNGSKLCTSGCLGYGDCVKVCPENAISVVNRVAVVNKARCIGCGLCAKACPNDLISVRRISQSVDVCCSSSEAARMTHLKCPEGCVGCRLCEKNCPSGAITVIDNHAVIDYEVCDNCGKCAEVCRTGAVRRIPDGMAIALPEKGS